MTAGFAVSVRFSPAESGVPLMKGDPFFLVPQRNGAFLKSPPILFGDAGELFL